jgi:hypothetical protein
VILVVLLVVIAVAAIIAGLAAPMGGAIRPFSLTTAAISPRGEIREWALLRLGRDLGALGYHLTTQTKSALDFTRTSRGFWTWFATVFCFPLGLVFFLAFKRVSMVTVLMAKTGTGGTEITVSGQAPARVAAVINERLYTAFEASDDDGEDSAQSPPSPTGPTVGTA